MSNLSDLDRATKAKSVLDSQAYQDAYKAVREGLIAGIEKCPMSDTQTAEDLRRCLKLLVTVQAHMQTALQSGKIVQFRIEQEEVRSRNPFNSIFRTKQ